MKSDLILCHFKFLFDCDLDLYKETKEINKDDLFLMINQKIPKKSK